MRRVSLFLLLALIPLGLLAGKFFANEEDFASVLAGAQQGDVIAQYRLGAMYAEGRLVPRNDDEILKWYRKSAEGGHMPAQLHLAGIYSSANDDAEAAKWYRMAAGQGHNAQAQNNLGILYRNGRGVTQNYPEAVKWYRAAADQGNPAGQFNLGGMYNRGEGVPRDSAEAFRWYRKAAEQGYAPAQEQLGSIYHSGLGVPQDYTEAINWYRKAAEQDYTQAQVMLGFIHLQGEGVPPDDVEAYFWYGLAARSGREKLYAENRDSIGEKLSAQALSDAQFRVETWQPKLYIQK